MLGLGSGAKRRVDQGCGSLWHSALCRALGTGTGVGHRHDQRLVLRERLVAVISPLGLDEDTVDLLELDGADLVTHHFEQHTQAEIAGAAQEALAEAPDASQRLLGEGIVAQGKTIVDFCFWSAQHYSASVAAHETSLQ